MNNPKVTVIVPVYNMERHLRQCVDSIIAQTFEDFELLLIDDGSSDSSGAICDEYANKDTRIRVFHKPNGGVSSARNMGLNNAQGEYITFIDADDWVEPDMFSSVLASIKDIEYRTIFSGMKRLSGKCVSWHAYYKSDENFISIDDYLKCHNIIDGLWGIFYYRMHIERELIRFNEQLLVSEDCVFNMQYFATYKGPVNCVMKKLYIYNDKNPNSLCHAVVNIEKCISQIKSAILVAEIPAEGNMAKYLQKMGKNRCVGFFNSVSSLLSSSTECINSQTMDQYVSELRGLYENAYVRFTHPNVNMIYAKYFFMSYIKYLVIKKSIKKCLKKQIRTRDNGRINSKFDE